MLKLRTKTAKQVPNGRIFKDAIVHLIIDSISVTKNNVIGKGYYYYYDENNSVVKLDTIETFTELALFEQIENNFLGELLSTQNVFDNVKQRLKETTLMNITQENGESYGILPEDLEDDI